MIEAQELTSNVASYMSRDPVSLPSTSSLREAVDTMAAKGLGNLVVTNGATIGILTEREILSYLHLYRKIPEKELGQIMVRRFTKVSPETSVLDAAKTMISTKTRLLVYEGEMLAGIITTSDFLRALWKTTDRNPSLDKVMSRNIFSLEGRSSIAEAVDLMNERRIGSVIVTAGGLHEAMFTERDLLSNVILRNIDLSEEVRGYCPQFLVTARLGICGRDAANLMLANKIKRLPIASNGKLVGIVTARDLVEGLTS